MTGRAPGNNIYFFYKGAVQMNWIDDTQKAINFIEDNLLENITPEDVSNDIHISTDYFQRTFAIVTGLSISEYIRNRRLTLAGDDVKNSQAKIIDISQKFCYDTPESFTKAFTRFHGVTPTTLRADGTTPAHFAPLSIKIYIKGGFGMKRKIIPNIPEISNYGNEVDYLLNVFDATLTVAAEEDNAPKFDKAEMAAYSGMGNRFVWAPGAWERGWEDMGSIDKTPFESQIRMLKFMGWEAKYVAVLRDSDGKPLNIENEQIRSDFITSIDKGYPVLAQRTDYHKFNVIIGYDNDGGKIISKDGTDTVAVTITSQTVERENWEDTVREYICLKGKTEVVPERVRVLNLLTFITTRARYADDINGCKTGFAAWEAYLHDLEHSDFSNLTTEEVGIDGKMGIYCDGLCQIYTHKEPTDYFRTLAKRYPEWRDELTIAANAMDKCAAYGDYLWDIGFTICDNGFEKFRDPAQRKVLADEGRRAMEYDLVAIEQFEKILAKENAK